ncbi:hypothetical protein CC85DRAFT_326876 [Cutaneotrichosporon oleaginosum]|uniref:Myb-like domain-containing protein n=1 Tax=Cutaneotrichosporon oleaginosum TaxID=879819 RepID=A0A0J0XSD4_9TREE|nr:uncharacterized protein CC85DRAFT_326876 [Cutaneotrichosporon oleaginosum]KLT43977.1 hypothetical protein CC85DRAFT_326876 [Cutaneotrichosporon oleaginosum]TXT04075.1 hypothetical protein COLE_07772 [Cutaneotrichosporon oleaginosum]
MPKVKSQTKLKQEVKSEDEDQERETTKRNRKAWTLEEEERFAAVIDKLCTHNLWRECKDDPVLAGRGAGGVISHWKAIRNKAFKKSS